MYRSYIYNQPNKVIDFGVHPSLHTNCHQQIAYCKLNLDYNKAHTDKIKKSMEKAHWGNLFIPHQHVAIFNKIVINIFSKFVPNRLITFFCIIISNVVTN